VTLSAGSRLYLFTANGSAQKVIKLTLPRLKAVGSRQLLAITECIEVLFILSLGIDSVPASVALPRVKALCVHRINCTVFAAQEKAVRQLTLCGTFIQVFEGTAWPRLGS
jgi:hypothetical protein